MKTIMKTSVTNGGPYTNDDLNETCDVNFFTSVGDLYNMTFSIWPGINVKNGSKVIWTDIDLKKEFR